MSSLSFITLFAAFRMLVGVTLLTSPSLVAKAFGLPMQPSSHTFAAGLIGARNLGLGALFWTAKSAEERRRALVANAVIEGIDMLNCALCLRQGHLDRAPAVGIGSAVALALTLTLMGLRNEGQGRKGR